MTVIRWLNYRTARSFLHSPGPLKRPRALLWKHMVGQGDWAWRFPADSGAVFGRVVSGRCALEPRSQPDREAVFRGLPADQAP